MGTYELIALVTIGLFAGLVGGMLGVGGSIIMIPAMTVVLGPDQHLYQSAAMAVNFFVVVPAVYQHRRAGAVDFATVARIIPLAIVSVVAGVGLSELPLFAGEGEVYLRGLFGLFLLFVAMSEAYRMYRPRLAGRTPSADGFADHRCRAASDPRTGPTCVRWRFAAAVAVPTGLVAGLLGVGGGMLAVPLQRRFLRLPLRTAAVNSATIIIATSLIGAMVKNYAFITEHDYSPAPLVLAAVLIPTAVAGSLAGSSLTHRAPLKFVRAAFLLLLSLAGIRLARSAVRSLWRARGGASHYEWHGQTCLPVLDGFERSRFPCSGIMAGKPKPECSVRRLRRRWDAAALPITTAATGGGRYAKGESALSPRASRRLPMPPCRYHLHVRNRHLIWDAPSPRRSSGSNHPCPTRRIG